MKNLGNKFRSIIRETIFDVDLKVPRIYAKPCWVLVNNVHRVIEFSSHIRRDLYEKFR
jgi:hypothetical protein